MGYTVRLASSTQFSNRCEYTLVYLFLGTYETNNIATNQKNKQKQQNKKLFVTDLAFSNKMPNQVNTVLYHGEPRLQSLVSKLFFYRDINTIWGGYYLQ